MENRANVDYRLSNDDVAMLFALAERQAAGAVADAEPKRQASIRKLLSCQYIEPAGDDPEAPDYRLTRAGEDFLTARGAGLNEA